MLDDGVYPGEPHYLARLRACGTTQGAQSDYDPAVARLCENRAEEIWDEAVEGLGQDVDLVTYQPPRIRLTVNLRNLDCLRLELAHISFEPWASASVLLCVFNPPT